jgi:alginate O-acetyltransferase complex protein AlgI
VSYALIMMGSILLNHLVGAGMLRSERPMVWLKVGVLLNVIILAIFKYIGFAVENLNVLVSALGADWHFIDPHIKLPLGISFFTFQQMSMLWDMYRSADRTRITLAQTTLYVSFFPQLIAGPIVRFHDIIDQIKKQRRPTVVMFRDGVERFCSGLFKKVVVANTMGALADEVLRMDPSQLSTPAAWLGVVAYALQIYFDFSGYSDMAIGLASMFGFNLLENFNHPYIASSIKDFWRRWHISLSTWFRDYVYIPLGGNRQGGWRVYRNLSIVFLLTGLWHGASWNFVVWGAFHGIFLMVERVGWGKVLERLPKPFGWAYTMVVVLVGWVFFRLEEMDGAVALIGSMAGQGGELSYRIFLNGLYQSVGVVALLAATPWPRAIYHRVIAMTEGHAALAIGAELVRSLLVLAMLGYCTVFLAGDTYNPFIYFRF